MLKITIHRILGLNLLVCLVAGAVLANAFSAQAEAIVGKPLRKAEPATQRAPAVRPARKSARKSARKTRPAAVDRSRSQHDRATQRPPEQRSVRKTVRKRKPAAVKRRRTRRARSTQPTRAVRSVRKTARNAQPAAVIRSRGEHARTEPRTPAVRSVRKASRKKQRRAVLLSRGEHARTTPSTPAVRSARKAAHKTRRAAMVRSLGQHTRATPAVRSARITERKTRSPAANRPRVSHARAVPSAATRGLNQVMGLTVTPASANWKMQGLQPRLIRLLAQVEQHYGRPLHIVSGCRSRSHNRRINGAKHSQHLHCNAADFLIPGVSKHKLAAFLKQLPGRGGVGLYCRSSFVHLDAGPKREWHWRCRRRKAYAQQIVPENYTKAAGKHR